MLIGAGDFWLGSSLNASSRKTKLRNKVGYGLVHLKQYSLDCIAWLLACQYRKSNNAQTLDNLFFLLAIASVLATLFAVSDSDQSPSLFLAVVLAGIGKWIWGKSQGKSARETFGRAIIVADTDDLSEMANRSRQLFVRLSRYVASTHVN